jgi:hypothetical protein
MVAVAGIVVDGRLVAEGVIAVLGDGSQRVRRGQDLAQAVVRKATLITKLRDHTQFYYVGLYKRPKPPVLC